MDPLLDVVSQVASLNCVDVLIGAEAESSGVGGVGANTGVSSCAGSATTATVVFAVLEDLFARPVPSSLSLKDSV